MEGSRLRKALRLWPFRPFVFILVSVEPRADEAPIEHNLQMRKENRLVQSRKSNEAYHR